MMCAASTILPAANFSCGQQQSAAGLFLSHGNAAVKGSEAPTGLPSSPGTSSPAFNRGSSHSHMAGRWLHTPEPRGYQGMKENSEGMAAQYADLEAALQVARRGPQGTAAGVPGPSRGVSPADGGLAQERGRGGQAGEHVVPYSGALCARRAALQCFLCGSRVPWRSVYVPAGVA